MNVFLGLDASNEELALKRNNTWAFPDNVAALAFDDYANMDKDEAMDAEIGRMLMSIPEEDRSNTYIIFVGDNGLRAVWDEAITMISRVGVYIFIDRGKHLDTKGLGDVSVICFE